jgi:hypothetical protein
MSASLYRQPSRTAWAIGIVIAALYAGACSGGDDQSTTTELSVSDLVSVLADPAAATDCELDPSGFPQLACGARATSAAEALGNSGDPAAVPALAQAIWDPETYPGAEEASWQALEKIGGPDVVAVLVETITTADSALDANRAAGLLGDLGGVEHNQILAEGGGSGGGSGYFTALVTINRDDATPLLPYLEDAHTYWVYGPLIAIGQDDTEEAVAATLPRWGDSTMAETFLNSGNALLEQTAREWAAAHGYAITKLPGLGSVTWNSD